ENLVRIYGIAARIGRDRGSRNAKRRTKAAGAVGRDGREIALQISRGRNRICEGVKRAFEKLFIVPEEEGLVLAVVDFGNPDRPTERAVKIVAAIARPHLSADAEGRAAGTAADREGVADVQIFVNEVVVARAVECVRA